MTMTRPSNELIARVAVVLNLFLLANILFAWVLVQFVHYHSQSFLLRPADYSFDVVDEDTFAKLSDPTVSEVAYPDGRRLIKSEAWHELNMPSYYSRSEGGKFYVEVSCKGTAAFAASWTNSMILVLMFAVPALGLSIWSHSNIVRAGRPAMPPIEAARASPSVD